MNRHAVPQNIMDIEFKLFGSLTVRQFGYVSGAFISALVLYFSGLPAIVVYPLITIFVVTGLALAFIVINGQPFAVWLSNFVFSLFSSQRKVYRKEANVPAVFTQKFKQPIQKKLLPRQQLPEFALENSAPNFDNMNMTRKIPNGTTENTGIEDILAPENFTDLDKYFDQRVTTNLSAYRLEKTQPDTSSLPVQRVVGTQFTVRTPGNAQIASETTAGNFIGFVTDRSGAALQSVVVTVRSESGEVLQILQTDNSGHFTANNLTIPGAYNFELKLISQEFPNFKVDLSGRLLPEYKFMAK